MTEFPKLPLTAALGSHSTLGQVPTVQHEVGPGFAQILEYSFEGCEVAVNIGNNGYPASVFILANLAVRHVERDKLDFTSAYIR
jgi:hypothetical protein